MDGSSCDTVQMTNSYGTSGRVRQVSLPYSSSCVAHSGGTPEFTTSGYDALGRTSTVREPDGSASQYSYFGPATTVTGPAGVNRILQSNGLGQLDEVCEVTDLSGNGACSTAAGGTGYLTTYSHDPIGDLTAVSEDAQPGGVAQSRTFKFDALGRMLSETTPEAGTATFTYGSATDSTCAGGSSVSAGDLVLTTDAAGDKVCLKYDLLRRITDRRLSTGQEFTYAYDGSAANNSLGRLASATAPATTETFVYDSMGRPVTITEAPAGLGQETISYAYNYLGEPLTEAAPPFTWGYQYNAAGRLTELYATANGWVFFGDRTYNPAGQLLSQALAPSNPGGDGSISFSYNSDGQPWERIYDYTRAGQSLTVQYQWGATVDGSGNVTSGDDDGTLRKLIFPDNPNWTVTYGHDDLGRVTSAVSADNVINVSENYDPFGNRSSQSGTLNESFAASTASNRIGGGFQYDNAGRITAGNWGSAGSRTIAWSAAGRITGYADGSESASFQYGPFGRRIEQTVNGQTTYYLYGIEDGGHPIAKDRGGTWYREAIMDGVRWGWLRQDGDGGYTLPDALGSTAVWAHDGTFQASRLYPFGEEAQSTQAEYKWTNQIRDSNYLDHFAFRTYSSNLARWLSPDPAGLAAVNPANPQTWNAYAYVGNQPLGFADALGLITQQATLTPVACPSPWMCLDPAYWQFVFDAAAEAMQIDQGGDVAPIETAAIEGRIQTAPPVGPSCSDALSAAGRGSSLAGVNAADANWAVLASAAGSHGIPTPVLAAIGVYESGFADIRQGSGGAGVGVFQNDAPPNPAVPYTKYIGADLPGQADAAAALLQGAENSLLRQGFSPGLALLGAIRDYNGTGHIPTPTLLEAGPQYLSLGTTGNDYVTNVFEIAASCF